MKGSKISLYGKINSGLCIGVYQPKECQGAMKDMFTRKASNARSRLQFAHANYTEPLWVLDSTFRHALLALAALIPLDYTTPRESKKLMSSPCCKSFYPESVKTSQVDIDHDVECLQWHSYFFSSMSSIVPKHTSKGSTSFCKTPSWLSIWSSSSYWAPQFSCGAKGSPLEGFKLLK